VVRSTIGAFPDDIKRLGRQDVRVDIPPLGAPGLHAYLSIGPARPYVIMTATAGNDTVRLLTQLMSTEF